LARLTDAYKDFFAAKRFGSPRSLNNVEQGDLLGGEALAALWAFAATADFCAINDRAGVDDAGIFMSAERANHLGVSPFEYSIFPTVGVKAESGNYPKNTTYGSFNAFDPYI
jgi:hypothetical protein